MNGPNQAPPPDTNIAMPEIPALRTFRVLRYVPDAPKEDIRPEVQEITVFAHLIQHTGTGGLIFSEYTIEPWGLDQKVRCGYASWIDFHEVVKSESAVH